MTTGPTLGTKNVTNNDSGPLLGLRNATKYCNNTVPQVY